MARRDPVVDIPANAYWFENVRVKLGQKRPYGVEKVVEPQGFRKMDSGYGHTNKWRNYKSGRRRPQAVLVNKVESLCPSTAAVFDHPLWKVARLPDTASLLPLSATWLRMLNIEVLTLLFKRDQRTGVEIRRGVTGRVLRRLCHRADLDGIAALAILLREAAERGELKTAIAAGDALYRGILHVATRGNEQLRCVIAKIFAMLIQRVFPFARDRTSYFCFQGVSPEKLCRLFVFSCQLRSEQFRSGRVLQASDVDMTISPGWCGPLGFLYFSPPVRTINRAGAQSILDENHSALICMWETASASLDVHGPATLARREALSVGNISDVISCK
ncbi:MAG: hypothetical protein E6Q34_06695 [Burkholderiaceae bacterium]|nr:MAG: hypothetical protein E6Q34_06695 [Burkholderiaceae bacterium]